MIDRRTSLRLGAGAASFGGIAIMATPSASAEASQEMSPEFARLIEAHRATLAQLRGYNEVVEDHEMAALFTDIMGAMS